MTMYMKLALHNLTRHPVRAVITITGIALGVAVILGVAMLNDTARQSLQRTVAEFGSGQTDIWIEEQSENTSSVGTRLEGFAETIMDTIAIQPSVQSVHPTLKLYVQAHAPDSQASVACYLYGIRLPDDRIVRNYVLAAGIYPETARQIMIGQTLAQRLKRAPGSLLIIPSPQGVLTLEVVGVLSSDEGAGALHNGNLIFADLPVVQAAFNYPHKITAVNIVLTAGAKPLAVARQIAPLFPPQIGIFTDPLMLATKGDESLPLRIVLRIFSFLSIVMALFIIYNTLSSTVEERRKEIGMLRLVGMTSRQMILLFWRQALLYAVCGVSAGIGLGVVIGWGMITLLQRVFAYQAFALVRPSWSSVLVAAGTGFMGTMAMALFPAIKTAHIPPLVVFREQDLPSNAISRVTAQTLFGVGMILISLLLGVLPETGKLWAMVRMIAPIFLCTGMLLTFRWLLPIILDCMSRGFARLFGVPGMLAVRSLSLRLRRTIVTLGALLATAAIAIAVLGAVVNMQATIVQWLEHTRWADVLVFSASGAEMADSILDHITTYPGIRDLNPLRYCFVSYDHPRLSDRGFLFQAISPARFQTFTGIEIVEGDTPAAMQRLEHEPAILINVGLAQILGVKYGDTLRLPTLKGEVAFTIAGTVVDYTDFVHRLGKIVYGSFATLQEYWGATGYTVLQLQLAEGYAEAEAKTQLLRLLSETYDVKLLTHREEKAEVSAAINRIFVGNYAITGLMFLIVFMGVFNTMLINVLFQLREFALLRTLGLLVRQIRLMVIYEALALAAIGAVFAVLLGFWFGWQLTLGASELLGILLQFRLPYGVAALTCILLLPVTWAATLYPQRVATRLTIAKIFQQEEQL